MRNSKIKVKIKGKTGILYYENEKKMSVDSELIFNPAGVTVYSETIQKWDPPYDIEILNSIEKKRISNNIKQELENMGYRVDMD